jgi:hypothetical protein
MRLYKDQEDGAPLAPAFTHYQGFDQLGPSEPIHRAWEDQTSYDPHTPEENWGQGNFSNYVPQEYKDLAYIQRGRMSFSTRGVHDAAPTPPPYSYHASRGYPGYQPEQHLPHPQPQPYHQLDFQNFDTRLTHLETGQQGIINTLHQHTQW